APAERTIGAPASDEPAAALVESLTAMTTPTTDAVPAAPARDDAGGTAAAEAATEQLVQAVRDTLSDWARAWAAQNVDDYLAFYDSAFEPSSGLSRAHWEIQRRTRVTGPDFIEVRLDDLDVDLLDADHASVVFSQHYRSDSYRDVVRKTMTLVRDGAAWKITSETALD
ncbi:MAG: hypothetical protein R3286_04730, partial [Gammaproteobacteria bacterium]|nr:hypothetical protein [Gammaproteobacteria bacterium]